MCWTSQTSLNKRQTKKQVISFVFLVCFIVVSFLSEVFIITHANHTHDHDGVEGTCATCVQMQNTGNVLKQLGTATTGVSFSLAGLFAISAIIRTICLNIVILTPITLKIRLNN